MYILSATPSFGHLLHQQKSWTQFHREGTTTCHFPLLGKELQQQSFSGCTRKDILTTLIYINLHSMGLRSYRPYAAIKTTSESWPSEVWTYRKRLQGFAALRRGWAEIVKNASLKLFIEFGIQHWSTPIGLQQKLLHYEANATWKPFLESWNKIQGTFSWLEI